MKIPKEMMQGLQDTVMQMLPYEEKFEPKSKEVITLVAIFDLIKSEMKDFKDMEGFMWFLAKKADNDRNQQIKLQDLYIALSKILK